MCCISKFQYGRPKKPKKKVIIKKKGSDWTGWETQGTDNNNNNNNNNNNKKSGERGAPLRNRIASAIGAAALAPDQQNGRPAPAEPLRGRSFSPPPLSPSPPTHPPSRPPARRANHVVSFLFCFFFGPFRRVSGAPAAAAVTGFVTEFFFCSRSVCLSTSMSRATKKVIGSGNGAITTATANIYFLCVCV